jgi:3-isopropylmalate/(R)-2-methylmalate dehydratase small subunit
MTVEAWRAPPAMTLEGRRARPAMTREGRRAQTAMMMWGWRARPVMTWGVNAMDKFTTLTGIAAPLPMANIDTDKVIPARFLKTIKRSGLGVHLFDTLRYDNEGKERPEFVLNQEPYRHAEILIAHENFGCGSSREHAPWALLDFGIRCVIAPDFADIFFNNSFKNGILAMR